MKNNDMVTAAGIIGIIAGVILGITMNNNSGPVKKTRQINRDWLETECRKDDGVWMYHVYYDDGEYEYETSDYTLEAAMTAMKGLVLA